MQSVSLPLDSGHGLFLVVFAVVLIAPRVARAVRIPELVALIGGGVLVGPHALGLVERAGAIEALGSAGLLYLMFQAGLALDPDDYVAHRRGALVFGGLTFSVPFVLGTVVHRALGFSVLAALLLGSCWASHTLVTYPMFQRARVVSNRAVAIGVAGTIVTDTAALLVLVALVRVHEGDLATAMVVAQVPLLIGAGALVLVGLPRLTGWFFAGVGRDRSTRFVFVMVALYGSSMLAEAVGVEPIIGAFFAGLAVNRHVVEGSELAVRIDGFGSALLVPVFLVSVGMLIDPVTAARDPRTLALAASFTGVVVVGKSVAAFVTARIYRFGPGERAGLVALSIPQAAATLAAVVVGYDVGLLDQATVDAAVLVILVTCVLGPALAASAIGRLPPPPARAAPIGRRILVPMPETGAPEPVIELAAALGRRDTGTVLPLTVLDLGAAPGAVRTVHARMVSTVEDTVLANGCEARTIVRLDLTPGAGILHAAVEHEATMILLAWDGRGDGRRGRFGRHADMLLGVATVPVVVARTCALGDYRRVVLRLSAADLGPGEQATAELAWMIGSRLSRHLKVPLCLRTDAGVEALAIASSITSHVTTIECVTNLHDAEADEPIDDLVVATSHAPIDGVAVWVAVPPSRKVIDLTTEPSDTTHHRRDRV